MKFIKKPSDGLCRDIHGRLVPGGFTERYNVGGKNVNTAWQKWLVKQLNLVSGGMDGLIKTNNGYSNQVKKDLTIANFNVIIEYGRRC